MITNTIEQNRTMSALSEQIHVFVDEQGVRRAAVGGYIYDYTTFCTMLLWAMGSSVAYIAIMSENGSMKQLKQLNSKDQLLTDKDNYKTAKYLYHKFGNIARQYTKEELANAYLTAIEQGQTVN